MFPGLNPKKMQAVMKQMGMSQTEIDANRVIIECDDKKIIIENPSVMKVNMQGQENFQISGDVSEIEADEETTPKEEPEEDNSEEDVKTLIEKTNCTEEEAQKALNEAEGDLTEAMLTLG